MSFWRTPKISEWYLTPSRSKNYLGKVGLQNLGKEEGGFGGWFRREKESTAKRE